MGRLVTTPLGAAGRVGAGYYDGLFDGEVHELVPGRDWVVPDRDMEGNIWDPKNYHRYGTHGIGAHPGWSDLAGKLLLIAQHLGGQGFPEQHSGRYWFRYERPLEVARDGDAESEDS